MRFVPIVANARIPGRAMVVVYLAAAILAAVGTAWLARQGGRRHALAWCLALLVAVESAPAATPVYRLSAPSLYARLKDASRPGAVCELPLGVRDGFGETGAFDSERALRPVDPRTPDRRGIRRASVAGHHPQVSGDARDRIVAPVVCRRTAVRRSHADGSGLGCRSTDVPRDRLCRGRHPEGAAGSHPLRAFRDCAEPGRGRRRAGLLRGGVRERRAGRRAPRVLPSPRAAGERAGRAGWCDCAAGPPASWTA